MTPIRKKWSKIKTKKIQWKYKFLKRKEGIMDKEKNEVRIRNDAPKNHRSDKDDKL